MAIRVSELSFWKLGGSLPEQRKDVGAAHLERTALAASTAQVPSDCLQRDSLLLDAFRRRPRSPGKQHLEGHRVTARSPAENSAELN
jgi:hypothetical protein